jgi:hypothetical protein
MLQVEKITFATTLDLNMGLYTIRLDPDAQKQSKSVMHFGKYQYSILSMGIFQDRMSVLMQQLNFVCTYLDDLVIIRSITFKIRGSLTENGSGIEIVV